jgi:hypothetical protein
MDVMEDVEKVEENEKIETFKRKKGITGKPRKLNN